MNPKVKKSIESLYTPGIESCNQEMESIKRQIEALELASRTFDLAGINYDSVTVNYQISQLREQYNDVLTQRIELEQSMKQQIGYIKKQEKQEIFFQGYHAYITATTTNDPLTMPSLSKSLLSEWRKGWQKAQKELDYGAYPCPA